MYVHHANPGHAPDPIGHGGYQNEDDGPPSGGGFTGGCVIDITDGLTEFCNRVGLKSVMSRYGEVTACRIPPVWERDRDCAYVKFKNPECAQAAIQAMDRKQVLMHGVPLSGNIRRGKHAPPPPKTRERSRERHTNERQVSPQTNYTPTLRLGPKGSETLPPAPPMQFPIPGMIPNPFLRPMIPGLPSHMAHPMPPMAQLPPALPPPPQQIAHLTVTKLLGPTDSLGLRLDGTCVQAFEHPEAAEAGWQVGDRIVEINGVQCQDVDVLITEFFKAKLEPPGTPINFCVLRR